MRWESQITLNLIILFFIISDFLSWLFISRFRFFHLDFLSLSVSKRKQLGDLKSQKTFYFSSHCCNFFYLLFWNFMSHNYNVPSRCWDFLSHRYDFSSQHLDLFSHNSGDFLSCCYDFCFSSFTILISELWLFDSLLWLSTFFSHNFDLLIFTRLNFPLYFFISLTELRFYSKQPWAPSFTFSSSSSSLLAQPSFRKREQHRDDNLPGTPTVFFWKFATENLQL